MEAGEPARQSMAATAKDVGAGRLRALVEGLAVCWRRGKRVERACASDALWALRRDLPRGLRLRLAASRSPRVLRRLALPVVGGMIAIALFALAYFGRPLWFPRPEIEWVDVPAGEYPMGSDPAVDQYAYDDERPQHTVYLDAYQVSRYEITNAEYARCVQAGACGLPTNRTYYEDPEYANHPVVYVSWYDARDFCAWVGGRLPTEAEWEVAARGPEASIYPWGNDWDTSRLNSGEGGAGGTTEVGSYPDGASWCGAEDMAGNVWEWVADWYDRGYYLNSPVENPTGPENGTGRGLRGDSWFNYGVFARCAYRFWDVPGVRDVGLGFRCARGAESLSH
jgi:formylglycine-generating enzyme required for sulfatase activity